MDRPDQGEAPMSTPFDYAQKQHVHRSRDWTGWCLVFVRSCFGVPARYGSATEAWTKAEHRHPETDPDKIPRGVPVFWTGGSHGFGHIALSRGGGSCWTTDLIRPGQVDVARIADVHARWGLTLAGWTEDINGVRVWSPPAPEPARKPAPKPKPRTGRPSVAEQTARNIEQGQPIKAVKRPKVAARMRQIVARLRAGTEK
jgi:hypothetical protein